VSAVEFEVRDNLTCHRCEGPLLLEARIPHSMTGVDGGRIVGTRGIGLCPSCDAEDPAAQGPLAYFTVHETVVDETEAAAILSEWALRVAVRPVGIPDEDVPESWPDDY
jgi:Family of unknown function (DUF6300)